jgi:hypothetical protein
MKMSGLKQSQLFRILGALLLLAVAPGTLLAAGPPADSAGERPVQGGRAINFGELEKVIEAELKETGTPGAAVAVVSGGRVVFSKGFGVASVEAGGAITPDTLFRLGSTTKMFTGPPWSRSPTGTASSSTSPSANTPGGSRRNWHRSPRTSCSATRRASAISRPRRSRTTTRRSAR